MIACAGSFCPDYTSNGKLLQDFTDFDHNLQLLFVSVIPDHTGIFVVLSFFDDESKAPKRFIEDLIDTNNLTRRIVWMCMTRLENIALKASWWANLPKGTKNELNKAVHYNADLFDSNLPTFDRMPSFSIDEWEIRHQFWI